MLKAYFNYPNPHITVHRNLSCGSANKTPRAHQRDILVDVGTASAALRRFVDKEFRFAAQAGYNDMWLTVEFADHEFELAVVDYVRRLFAQRYSPFLHVVLSLHC